MGSVPYQLSTNNTRVIYTLHLTSEAICKTIGSMMGSHGSNKIRQPKYFNMEMVLCFNLGLLHFLYSLHYGRFWRFLSQNP